jgi:hypothetical protein
MAWSRKVPQSCGVDFVSYSSLLSKKLEHLQWRVEKKEVIGDNAFEESNG